jgi:hypothetical protein
VLAVNLFCFVWFCFVYLVFICLFIYLFIYLFIFFFFLQIDLTLFDLYSAFELFIVLSSPSSCFALYLFMLLIYLFILILAIFLSVAHS